jgi:ACS family tartrate transporter-like MFS transporter
VHEKAGCEETTMSTSGLKTIAAHDVERSAIRKTAVRIVPIVVLLYIVSYVDRINIGFAALTMNGDLGIASNVFGLAAGIFFIGYFLFELPSNLLMVRFGARRWIARILLTWGLLSCATAFVAGEKSFLVLRFLLGAAEAGFFPGIIFYLNDWFPARYRGRILAAFMFALPLSLAVGAPLSTALLGLDGVFSLRGWQWMFLIEGLPPVLLTVVALKLLKNSPDEAHWLSPDERRWLAAELARERAAIHMPNVSPLRIALVSPIVLVLAFVYFCATSANLGLSFFLPQMIREQGYSIVESGWITSLTYVAGAVGMIGFGYLSDRLRGHYGCLVAPLLIAVAGLVGTAWLDDSVWGIVAMSVAAIGILGFKSPFWGVPSGFLSGPAAAAAIASINSIGNLGGFAGPFLLGAVRQTSGDYRVGLYVLAVGLLVSAFAVRGPARRPRQSFLAR